MKQFGGVITKHNLQDFKLDGTMVIIGKPGVGKTYVAKLFQDVLPTHKLIHTDEYMAFEYKEALYRLMEDIAKETVPLIIEGVLAYRLLRKGQELGTFEPELIVEVITHEEEDLLKEWEARHKDPKKVYAMIKGNETVYAEYVTNYTKTHNGDSPSHIYFQNDRNSI